jgi:hypothetical protein
LWFRIAKLGTNSLFLTNSTKISLTATTQARANILFTNQIVESFSTIKNSSILFQIIDKSQSKGKDELSDNDIDIDSEEISTLPTSATSPKKMIFEDTNNLNFEDVCKFI